jgi:hypothetical protein
MRIKALNRNELKENSRRQKSIFPVKKKKQGERFSADACPIYFLGIFTLALKGIAGTIKQTMFIPPWV